MDNNIHFPHFETRQNVSADNIRILKGIPSSSGIIIGQAIILESETFISPNEKILFEQIPDEIERFRNAVLELNDEFTEVLKKADDRIGNIVSILETNLFVLNDPYINDEIEKIIRQGYTSESSVIQEFEKQKSFFKSAKDELLRERALEIDHIKQRLLAVLIHRSIDYSAAKNKIVVSKSLTPTDLVNLKDAGILGFITEAGGITSHVSILARSFELPAVIGVKNASLIINENANLILDGFSGSVFYNPDSDLLNKYFQRIEEIEKHKAKLGELVKIESATKDKIRIHLLANVDKPEDVDVALLVGAEGIGLVRSEILVISHARIPDEETQEISYSEIAERAYPNIVTIRAFDIGSDKYSEGMPHHEDNPALGYRGIRYLLAQKDIFKIQIRAVLKASKNKNIRFMLPMIINSDEVLQSKKLIEECKAELTKKDFSFDKNMPLGIMIETPSAALTSDFLAKEVDFFSIGTNDLTQYTLATDRTNDLVADKFDTFHPSVIKLIKITAEAAKKNNIPIGICGELAGHSAATSLLIGMGINELSVAPAILLELKNRVINLSYKKCKKLVQQVLKLDNSTDILKLLENGKD
jgi:phosphotransferase system enzyme I (PtsI)